VNSVLETSSAGGRKGIAAGGRGLAIEGLTSEEAARRLQIDGPNALPSEGRRSILSIALEVLKEPMLLLLVAASVIYLTLGDRQEAALIVSLASATVIISVVQQTRSERVIERLAHLTDPLPIVIRDGRKQRVPSATLVRGDLLAIEEGDRVAADAVIVEGHGIEADEALLTGESIPVAKSAAPLSGIGAQDVVADKHKLFSGSLIVRGRGLAAVAATGQRTAIGQIGKSVSQIEREAPPLREQIRGTVIAFAVGGIGLSVLAFLLSGLARGAWLDGLLGGIALSMALLPEEFPVVLIVFLVMGAWRISRVNVLTRRAAAIETLGSATVLCTDKTGTLTENRMAIAELWAQGSALRLRGNGQDEPVLPVFARLAAAGRRACEPSPIDPMDIAFHSAAKDLRAGDWDGDFELVRRYPLSESFLAVVNVWRTGAGTGAVAACKGAPEAVLDHCRLGVGERERIEAAIADMASRGMRVIAVAACPADPDALPETAEGFVFKFEGLAGLQDPLREGVYEAVAECRAAGIRVIMITGDHPVTACAIAREAGIEADDSVLTGDDLARLGDEALAGRVRQVTIFARTRPEQKLRIVNALKAGGEIVAMTGDGVNDAPALKSAHIGIAMGRRGTEVAREASSIVLLDDNFASIVRTIRLGRRIYDNLRKAISFVMSAHVPIAGLALMPLLFGLPLILFPVHIAFIELIVDPVSSLAFEAEPTEEDAMNRPPRDPAEPLLPYSLIVSSLMHGVAALGAVLAVYFVALANGLPQDLIRAISFVSLVAASFTLVVAARSLHMPIMRALATPNSTMAIALGIDAALVLLIVLTPLGRDLFSFAPLGGGELLAAASAGAALLLVFAVGKAAPSLWRNE
jgi:Ca2+-transporting ATPase